jgi:hypothetical protein
MQSFREARIQSSAATQPTDSRQPERFQRGEGYHEGRPPLSGFSNLSKEHGEEQAARAFAATAALQLSRFRRIFMAGRSTRGVVYGE